MGIGHDAICNNCGKHFQANEGCSMISELLHCELCGKERWTSFSNFGSYPSESPAYEQGIDKMVSVCKCGGEFKASAPARCPHCKSSDWRADPEGRIIYYD